jgi:acyl dehydratase
MDEKLAEYYFNEIKIGLKRNFQVTITESMLNDFAKLTGDFNPLHMDQEYAASTSFKKRIVHGMFLASFFSKLVGVHLPGKNALYFSQSLKFVNPCFIGEKITVEGEVIDKSIATKIIKLQTRITNEQGKILVDGETRVIIRND